MYDELVDTCMTRAEILQMEIDAAQDRVEEQDDCDPTAQYHEDIVQKWIKFQRLQGLATRSEQLCGRERAVRQSARRYLPYDTESASLSRFAWVMELQGQIPVSPMWALLRLDDIL
jgi:hypothetical protein